VCFALARLPNPPAHAHYVDCGKAHGIARSSPYKGVYKVMIIEDNENRYHN